MLGLLNLRFLALWLSLGAGVWSGTSSAFVTQIEILQGVEQAAFPQGPDAQLTPGELCQSDNVVRYPERVNYCERDVESATKREIIAEYDERLGYQIQRMDRGDFKIDHLIPLCAGGSNDEKNLWPQHKSIFVKTDIIEDLVCQLMAAGKLRQSEVVALIRDVKNNLDKAPAVTADLRARLSSRR